MSNNTVTRYIGSCQICEGEFKLDQAMNMVHHGYKRPGHGYIVGDCRAVGAPAYEQSCEALKEYTEGAKGYLESQQLYLAKLESGEITEITIKVRSSYRGQPETTVVLKAGVDAEFEHHLRSRIQQQKSHIRMVEQDIERCEKRIAAWKLLPIRTIEEAEAAKRASKDVAKAARDAKKAAKLAEKIASYQKRLDSAVRRKTVSVIADIFDSAPSKLRDIADVSPTDAIKMLKRDHLWAAFGLDPENPRSRENRDRCSNMLYGDEDRKVKWPAGL